ncbi:hypothetical protein FH972_023136 [Carpinus fangiana]|uniref:Uncharacterized protein n=1 Tax=Carpinus fangiana TaxID=176857 RepID=A0A5N6KUA7_9ROSI|nr:hypothetical protein FH972_023136 [Carpinus fangiana]
MLIKRDTDVDLKVIPEPKNPAKWWKVHRKLLREKEAKVENLTATLKAQMDRLKADKDSQSTTTISTLVNPFPRHRGIPASRRPQGDQSRSGAGSSGSTFLARAREHARERATRNNASVLKARPLVGTVPFAPKTMSDRVLGSNPKPRVGATTVQSAASGASQASSRPNQVVARPPVRVSKPLMGSRKRLPSSSNVFGPNRHIY